MRRRTFCKTAVAACESQEDVVHAVNFGVATEFVYKLHSFDPTIYGGNVLFDLTSDFLIGYGENYPQLVEAKNKYDPSNLFHLNANIRPTA